MTVSRDELWLALHCAEGAEARRMVVRDGALALVARTAIANRDESEGNRTHLAPDSASARGRFAASQPSQTASASGAVRVFDGDALPASAALLAEFDSDSIRGSELALRGSWMITDEDDLLVYHLDGARWRLRSQQTRDDVAFFAGVGFDRAGTQALSLCATNDDRGRFDVRPLSGPHAEIAQTVMTDKPITSMVASGEGWAFVVDGGAPRIQWIEPLGTGWAATRSVALTGLAPNTRLWHLHMDGATAIVQDRDHAWLIDTRTPQRALPLELPATVTNASWLQTAITSTHTVVAVGASLLLQPRP